MKFLIDHNLGGFARREWNDLLPRHYDRRCQSLKRNLVSDRLPLRLQLHHIFRQSKSDRSAIIKPGVVVNRRFVGVVQKGF
jgi:hypothetical protein